MNCINWSHILISLAKYGIINESERCQSLTITLCDYVFHIYDIYILFIMLYDKKVIWYFQMYFPKQLWPLTSSFCNLQMYSTFVNCWPFWTLLQCELHSVQSCSLPYTLTHQWTHRGQPGVEHLAQGQSCHEN